MMDNILVTGAHGFVGTWVQSLLKDKYQLFTFENVDITQYDQIDAYLKNKKIDKVIHLAAQSFVPVSVEDPLSTYQVNFLGTCHLLNALRAHSFSGKFLYVSSSDVYGHSSTKLPVRETHLTKPLNPYAVSKHAAEGLAYQWSQTADFDIIIVRPFNHIGPGQKANFVVSSFAKQCADIKKGRQSPIVYTGNIDVLRDFTDVRDVINSYEKLLEHGQNGEFYNVCSGKSVLIRDILNQLIVLSGKNIEIKTELSRLRKTDIPEIIGSYTKLFNTTGWKPTIYLEDSLSDIFNHWYKEK